MNISMENQSTPAPRFATIREAATRTGLSQFYLRSRCIDRSIPCIRCGQKYMVDLQGLMDTLDSEARGNAAEG